jgi:hypothetical protein
VFSICRRLHVDSQSHIGGVSEAKVIRRQSRQALDYFCGVPQRDTSTTVLPSIVFSLTAVLQMPQAGAFLETTACSAHSETEMSFRVRANATSAPACSQLSLASIAEESFFLLVNDVGRKTLLEVSVFLTGAWHFSERSLEFGHEMGPSGEAEERGQENKMKLHC